MAKIRNIALKYLKKICYNFRKNMTDLEQNIKLRIKTH